MNDGIQMMLCEDGVARPYDDTYDITIHCESQEERNKAVEKIKSLNWNRVDKDMPKEKDSIFARYYGTARWKDAMYRKKSADVQVTVRFKDGTKDVEVAHTSDGKWKLEPSEKIIEREVIAWKPLSDPYEGE